jgi:hypothetical protein
MMKATLDVPTTSQKKQGLFATRPPVYVCIVLIAFFIGYAYYLRTFTILACKADLYGTDRYLADCEAQAYGDYEHGAFWFDLEPSALDFLGKANVLFLGTSRIQMAFSTQATADWFLAASSSYYLMGFGFDENVVFAEEILRRIHPKAAVYVINVDDFFERSETSPMKTILHNPNARNLYGMKRRWQGVHQSICTTFAALCGNNYVIYRSRETGAYTKRTNKTKPAPVSYDEVISQDVVESETAAAISFFSHQDVKRDCVILTMVPTVETKIGTAKALAKALGMELVVPGGRDGFQTFDGSHLDQSSAERWSRAFLQAASSRIQSCLERQRTQTNTGPVTIE